MGLKSSTCKWRHPLCAHTIQYVLSIFILIYNNNNNEIVVHYIIRYIKYLKYGYKITELMIQSFIIQQISL